MLQEWNTWKILTPFFDYPTHRFHLRELSRILKCGPGKVERDIQNLTKESIIKEIKEKNLRIFLADRENEEFKRFKIIYNVYNLKELTNFLNENLGYPQAIILYGTTSHGEDTEDSDFDIFVIGHEKELDLKKFEKKIKRRIHIMFAKDIETLKKIPKLFNNLINGVILSGYLKVF